MFGKQVIHSVTLEAPYYSRPFDRQYVVHIDTTKSTIRWEYSHTYVYNMKLYDRRNIRYESHKPIHVDLRTRIRFNTCYLCKKSIVLTGIIWSSHPARMVCLSCDPKLMRLFDGVISNYGEIPYACTNSWAYTKIVEHDKEKHITKLCILSKITLTDIMRVIMQFYIAGIFNVIKYITR